MIAGFDLVGQEDIGKPLAEIVDKITQNSDIKYFFHAGETGRQTITQIILHQLILIHRLERIQQRFESIRCDSIEYHPNRTCLFVVQAPNFDEDRQEAPNLPRNLPHFEPSAPTGRGFAQSSGRRLFGEQYANGHCQR